MTKYNKKTKKTQRKKRHAYLRGALCLETTLKTLKDNNRWKSSIHLHTLNLQRPKDYPLGIGFNRPNNNRSFFVLFRLLDEVLNCYKTKSQTDGDDKRRTNKPKLLGPHDAIHKVQTPIHNLPFHFIICLKEPHLPIVKYSIV